MSRCLSLLLAGLLLVPGPGALARGHAPWAPGHARGGGPLRGPPHSSPPGPPPGPPRGDAQGAARRDVHQGAIYRIHDIERRVVPTMVGMQYLGFEYDPLAMAYRLKFIRAGRVTFIDVDARSGDVIGQSR